MCPTNDEGVPNVQQHTEDDSVPTTSVDLTRKRGLIPLNGDGPKKKRQAKAGMACLDTDGPSTNILHEPDFNDSGTSTSEEEEQVKLKSSSGDTESDADSGHDGEESDVQIVHTVEAPHPTVNVPTQSSHGVDEDGDCNSSSGSEDGDENEEPKSEEEFEGREEHPKLPILKSYDPMRISPQEVLKSRAVADVMERDMSPIRIISPPATINASHEKTREIVSTRKEYGIMLMETPGSTRGESEKGPNSSSSRKERREKGHVGKMQKQPVTLKIGNIVSHTSKKPRQIENSNDCVEVGHGSKLESEIDKTAHEPSRSKKKADNTSNPRSPKKKKIKSVTTVDSTQVECFTPVQTVPTAQVGSYTALCRLAGGEIEEDMQPMVDGMSAGEGSGKKNLLVPAKEGWPSGAPTAPAPRLTRSKGPVPAAVPLDVPKIQVKSRSTKVGSGRVNKHTK